MSFFSLEELKRAENNFLSYFIEIVFLHSFPRNKFKVKSKRAGWWGGGGSGKGVEWAESGKNEMNFSQ